jgi:hypothetical protein
VSSKADLRIKILSKRCSRVRPEIVGEEETAGAKYAAMAGL